MEDEFIAAIGEFSLHVAAKMMGKTIVPEHEALPGPGIELDRTALANAILDSCVEQASTIIARLGVAHQLDNRRGDFGFIVGIIAREQMSLLEYLTGVKVSVLDDTTRDIEKSCERAVLMLQRGGTA